MSIKEGEQKNLTLVTLVTIGDRVIRKDQAKKSKWSTNFVNDPMVVTDKEGPGTTVQSQAKPNRSFRRNVSHLKRINPQQNNATSSPQ